jgi:hypothetical protein
MAFIEGDPYSLLKLPKNDLRRQRRAGAMLQDSLTPPEIDSASNSSRNRRHTSRTGYRPASGILVKMIGLPKDSHRESRIEQLFEDILMIFVDIQKCSKENLTARC